MAVSEEYLAYVVEQLADWGPLVSKKMFGGVGLFREGMMFGLLANDTAYLKTDDVNRADYEAAGMEAFHPFEGKKRAMTMPYYEIPADILEDTDRLAEWADRAFAAAVRAKRG